MIQCYIALGSNLENPLQQVCTAVSEIDQMPLTQRVASSPWYQSTAIGPAGQPDYINGVAEILTELTPPALLSELQRIENRHHRIRAERWGARTLDLDIILYGDKTIDLPQLTIPHPRMMERNFVLYPLADIAPEVLLPSGNTASDELRTVSNIGLRLVDPASYPTIAHPN